MLFRNNKQAWICFQGTLILSLKKLILSNLLVFLFLLLFFELILGDWFSKYNFGYHMRDKRLVFYNVNTIVGKEKFDFNYIRNHYGFRMNNDIEPSKIRFLFQGGSTGDEMPLPFDKTIVGNINENFKNDKLNLQLVNASLSGKSTAGYNNDFEYWFSRLEDFKPKVIIFFSGHNDADILSGYNGSLEDFKLEVENKTFSNKVIKRIYDYISNNSFILIKIKKIKDQYIDSRTQKVLYDLSKENLYENFSTITYDQAKLKYKDKSLNDLQIKTLEFYKYNLKKLKNYIIEWNIIPIFVTQVKFNGISSHRLFLINEETKKFCNANHYKVIKLDEFYNPALDDYFDDIHTTPQGSKKVADFIYPVLKNTIETLSIN